MKKKLFLLFVWLCLLTGLTARSYLPGDVNHSNSIDIVDALTTAQYSVGLNPGNFDAELADVNASGIMSILAIRMRSGCSIPPISGSIIMKFTATRPMAKIIMTVPSTSRMPVIM